VPLGPRSVVPDSSTLEGTMVDDSALYMDVDFKIMVSLKGTRLLVRFKRKEKFTFSL
jgi:hypothetical protein